MQTQEGSGDPGRRVGGLGAVSAEEHTRRTRPVGRHHARKVYGIELSSGDIAPELAIRWLCERTSVSVKYNARRTGDGGAG